MPPEELEVIAPDAVEEEVAPETTEEVEAAAEEVETDWEAEAKKAKDLANNYKIRAEKAEKKAKEAPVLSEGQISQSDSIALAAAIAKGTVDEEDLDRVQKFAKDEGVSIKEALKSDELKAILQVRVEKRTTANAANTSNVRRGPTKASDEVLVSNAEKGKLPDSDEDIERLMKAMVKKSKE